MTCKNRSLRLLPPTGLGAALTAALATPLASLWASPALAQDKPYYYGGISVGAARGSIDEGGITARQLHNNGIPVTVTGISIDDKDTAYRTVGGYQMNKNFGLEVSYFNHRRMAQSSYRPPVAVAPAPPPIGAAPIAAPASPVAHAPAPMSRRVSFSAESLFGFDQANIQAQGKTASDSFAREVKGTQFQVIVVEGHADRLGSAAYNQTLSLQRADAVKSPLVSAGGFDPKLISTAGMSESAPVTQAGDCKASLHQGELRACLQPDRRVDVEVKGVQMGAFSR